MGSTSTNGLMSIGRFAALTGLPITTLRHYDEIGLFHTSTRRQAIVGTSRARLWQPGSSGTSARWTSPVDHVIDIVDAVGDSDRLARLLDAQAERLAVAAALARDAQDQFDYLAKELRTMSTPSNRIVGPLAAVRIFCSDLEPARRFYREQLGLTELTATEHWAVYDVGPAQLIVERVAEGDPNGDDVGRFAGFSFSVDDAATACADLAARGVPIVAAPELQPWGGTLAHIADPDGNVITLVQYPAER